MVEIKIYTDGACSGNPGPGGWGAILIAFNHGEVVSEKEIFGGAAETTNNRMELMAAIKGLETLNRPTKLTLITDSKYLKDGMTKWLSGWISNNWKNSAKKEIKNLDLWQTIHKLSENHDVSWEWVKGHNSHKENERADYLARLGLSEYKN